jgi:hypothetical protein
MSTEMPEIKRLFMLFHGMYGNQLLDKFRTGKLNDKGEDMGLISAQAVWLNDLRKYDFEVIRQAVEKCKERHPTFAPTLPEFLLLCKASAPRQIAKPNVPQLGMSDEMRAKIRQQNRETLAQLKIGKLTRTDYGTGLPALLLMVAKAIGDAGGDEVKALLTLESKFAPNASALRH